MLSEQDRAHAFRPPGIRTGDLSIMLISRCRCRQTGSSLGYWAGLLLASTVILPAAVIQPAMAGNLVTNGDFSQFSAPTTQSFQFGTNNDSWTPPITPTDWSNTATALVFLPGSTVANGQYGGVSLWSPANGSNNGFTNASPTGGNFVASDGDYSRPISQQISGLQVGTEYSLSFSWAGAQQNDYTGPSTDFWQVSLGGETETTTKVTVPSEGFSGWMDTSLSFIATDTTEDLQFLAESDASVPPMLLLANVSLVPEPSSLVTLIVAVAGIAGIGLYRRRADRTGIASA
jgi:hypothetical protein